MLEICTFENAELQCLKYVLLNQKLTTIDSHIESCIDFETCPVLDQKVLSNIQILCFAYTAPHGSVLNFLELSKFYIMVLFSWYLLIFLLF